MNNMPNVTDAEEVDMDLVAMWVRKDPIRWISGFLGGVLAALIALCLAMIISQASGWEAPYPAKLMASILLGTSATEYDSSLGVVLLGVLLTATLCGVLGAIFAHFTFTNRLKPLLAMGFVWGTFTWIFVWCLFLPSFNSILWAKVSPIPAFFVCVAYGLSLGTIKMIYSALGGETKRG